MFINLEEKDLTIKYYNEYLNLPKEIQTKIDMKWKEVKKDNPMLWDGDIFCVQDIRNTDKGIKIICKKSKYSHYLYQERVGLPQEYECRNISAGTLIETSDEYFVIGELAQKTSFPGVLQVPGGNIDNKDIKNGEIILLNTIIRETKEEIDIDLNDKNMVTKYKVIFFYNADEGIQPGLQVFATAKLTINRIDMENHFNKYYKMLEQTGREIELKKLHFLNKHKCIDEIEQLNNPKRNYLKPLLEQGSKQ